MILWRYITELTFIPSELFKENCSNDCNHQSKKQYNQHYYIDDIVIPRIHAARRVIFFL